MKLEKVRKNQEFRVIYRKGKSLSNRYLVLYIYRNNKKLNRLGVSVSKKVGNSVVRSRIKRLISESYRLNKHALKNSYDFVFIARNSASGKSYVEIDKSIKNLFSRAGLCIVEKNID